MARGLQNLQRPIGAPLRQNILICPAYPCSGKVGQHRRCSGRQVPDVCAAERRERVLDPLEEALTDTWGDPQEGQWGYEYPSEAEFLDTVYQDQGTSEELTQGIVALALTGLIVAATSTILWRILIVAWALVAAAVRYSIVAIFLILIAAFLT
ncbi:hypothetical protein WJX74_010100 [Apatococcus lobatus]|uniref:Uncharacterized protein n=1 Tax=Apatococcus lobatus TaxID=904363 RepID=A0AAW1QN94_9CHLO